MHLILTEPTRIDKLKAWFIMRRITQGQLAKILGMSQFRTCKLLNRDHASPQRVEQLRTLGVPEDLLPETRVPQFGRKPKQPLPAQEHLIE